MSRRIGVVGTGASGTIVATRLLETLGKGDELFLIGGHAKVGCGVAYGTTHPDHRLNVRAQNMSIYPDEPAHFLNWLAEEGIGSAAELSEAFLPRLIFGDYLASCLAKGSELGEAHYHAIEGRAVSAEISGEGIRLTIDGGWQLDLDRLILATGNLPPKIPKAFLELTGNPRFISNPWTDWNPNDLGDEDVLILGSGLTMVDTVIVLRDSDFKGRVYARSRRGLVPHPHRRGPKPEPVVLDEQPASARELVREIACRVRGAGQNWRPLIDGCRSQTQKWWSSISWDERRRLVTAIGPYWDAHRHRVPDEVYAVLKQKEIEGSLDIASGRVASVTSTSSGFEVAIKVRGGEERLLVGWIINCTGPGSDYETAKVPLLDSLVAAGLAQFDPLGMGLMIDGDHATEASGRVFAVGPICKGCLWETTAIPEIRSQAQSLARLITRV